MSITLRSTRRVPPHNPFPHWNVEPDPDNPERYRECCVYDKVTGERLVRAKVDCRELLASGQFVATPEECDAQPEPAA
jgi:hypothetical protein